MFLFKMPIHIVGFKQDRIDPGLGIEGKVGKELEWGHQRLHAHDGMGEMHGKGIHTLSPKHTRIHTHTHALPPPRCSSTIATTGPCPWTLHPAPPGPPPTLPASPCVRRTPAPRDRRPGLRVRL